MLFFPDTHPHSPCSANVLVASCDDLSWPSSYILLSKSTNLLKKNWQKNWPPFVKWLPTFAALGFHMEWSCFLCNHCVWSLMNNFCFLHIKSRVNNESQDLLVYTHQFAQLNYSLEGVLRPWRTLLQTASTISLDLVLHASSGCGVSIYTTTRIHFILLILMYLHKAHVKTNYKIKYFSICIQCQMACSSSLIE